MILGGCGVFFCRLFSYFVFLLFNKIHFNIVVQMIFDYISLSRDPVHSCQHEELSVVLVTGSQNTVSGTNNAPFFFITKSFTAKS